ncbi:restriction endonuclease [Kitasatospora sp. MAP5-34]|uniref:restriction endonuclease n=1 Tax=Kitasatospora sp. MAP5-34 TaxID=3035102 RepID=UPI0024767191|nr:restriction endonuclease [Kitasatospora sp. MAP5-34]
MTATTATVLQPGFLAAVFRDLGADAPEQHVVPEQRLTDDESADSDSDSDRDSGRDKNEDTGADASAAAHGRAAALTHHRTLTVQAEHERLADLLRRSALPVSAMDFESQLRSYEPRPYPAGEPESTGGAEPRWTDYAPPQAPGADPAETPSRRLLDSGYQRELAQARLRHQRDLRAWRTRQTEAADSGQVAAREAHEQAEQARARAVREYNESLEECRRAYRLAEPAAVESLLERALAAAEGSTQDLPAPCRAVFRPLTRTAILDLELPPLALVPSLAGYRLTTEGEIEPVPRPTADRASDYLRLAARLALRALQAADAVDTDEILTGVVLNGWLRPTPEDEPVCLLSVDADRDALGRTRLLPPDPSHPSYASHEAPPQVPGEGIYTDAEQDEALVRLRELAAVVTPDPYALAGVEPSGIAGLTVPSAADLSSNEFAHLVRELLTRGGLAEWSVRLRGPAGLVATGEGGPRSGLPGRWVVWASRGASPVEKEELRTLVDAVREEGADRGLRLTCGRFAEAALDLAGSAEYQQIHLVDGDGVRELTSTHLGLPLSTGD